MSSFANLSRLDVLMVCLLLGSGIPSWPNLTCESALLLTDSEEVLEGLESNSM